MAHYRNGFLKPLTGVDPITLADLMLALPLQGGITLTTLEPGAERAVLVLERAGRVVDAFAVEPEIAVAACARLASAAKLDLLATGGTPEGDANAAKVRVRVNDDAGELLVSIVARADGLEAEVRTLSVNGRAPASARSALLKRCARCAAYQPAQRTACEHDGAALVDVQDRPSSGGTIGQYVVGSVLGEGGSSVVFAGHHAIIGRPVAIKVLHRSCAGDPGAARRFIAEARAASRLQHPNIIEVTDYGLLADDRPYTVMELVRGTTVLDRVPNGHAVEIGFALRVVREIAAALVVAHGAGIVHNDLKPANVMLLEGSVDLAPRVKVLDFDAASHVGTTQDPESELIFGTAPYMSPEHGWGRATDARSDIYSVGVMLYELLTGALPFAGTNVSEVHHQHAFAPVPPMQRAGVTFPESVTTLVSRCLRKSPDERPQSAAELIGKLDEALAALSRPAWRRWLP